MASSKTHKIIIILLSFENVPLFRDISGLSATSSASGQNILDAVFLVLMSFRSP